MIDKMKVIIVVAIILGVTVSLLYYNDISKPVWFDLLNDEQQMQYLEYINEKDNAKHRLSVIGDAPYPDPDVSFVLPLTPLLWWQGHGCVPTSLGMIFRYYDEYFGTNYLGNQIPQSPYNLPDTYDKLATVKHYEICNPSPTIPDVDCDCCHYDINCDSLDTCCGARPNECLADFINTCDGGTKSNLAITKSDDPNWVMYPFKDNLETFIPWTGEYLPQWERYCDPDDWYNSHRDPVYYTIEGNYLQDITYDMIKDFLNCGIPIYFETSVQMSAHASCIVGWSEDYRYYDSPQILIYTTWDDELFTLVPSEIEPNESWFIDVIQIIRPDPSIDLTDINPVIPDSADMNGDGNLDSADVRFLALHILGAPGYENPLSNPDINNNGDIDSADCRYLAMHMVGAPGYEELYP